MREPLTVALLGADGAGKSSVAARLPAALDGPVTVRYGGTNGRRRRLADGGRGAGPPSAGASAERHGGSRLRATLRLGRLLARLWWGRRQVRRALERGHLVVTDRHAFADHLAHGLLDPVGLPWDRRIHLAALRRWQPPPDVAILLEAPPAVLHARKGEGTIEDLERRQREYQLLRPFVRELVTVDAARPLDAVLADVARAVTEATAAGRDATASVAPPPSGRRAR